MRQRAVFVAVGDFNADGNEDLAVAGQELMVLRGDGKGNFADPESYAIAGVSCLTVGDFNGDGKSDLAATVAKTVVVTLNDGRGKFGSPRSFPVGGEGVALTDGDFNGDGRIDLATINPKETQVVSAVRRWKRWIWRI